MGTELWKCGVRLDTGELCGKPYAKMMPGEGCFCAFHLFQLKGEKSGPLCCVFDPCPNPVTWVEIMPTPKEEVEYDSMGTPLNVAWLQGFCDQHMDEEWAVNFPKHLISVTRVVKLHTGGIPPYLDGPSKAK